jgi:ADP-dependent NAD(P)H-hydrate dehydratase
VRRVAEIPPLPPLPRDAHKGERGRVLVVAGSLRMSGAARLAGFGALRGGAGLVTVACPDVVQLVVAAELPCALTLPLPSKRGVLAASGAREARAAAESADAVVAGPGLTTLAGAFLARFLRGLGKPLVLDADALNALAAEGKLLDAVPAPRVLTPHPGEAARLLGREIPKDRDGRAAAAADLAERFRCVTVLKGAGTVVTDGDRLFVCRAGNPGMATGGTGDVLAGLLGARLAGGADPFEAAVQSVHAHARAGDLAAASVGERAMIATDLVAALPAAIAELAEPAPPRTAPKGGGSRRLPGRGR